MHSSIGDWIRDTALLPLGAVLFVLMALAAVGGRFTRRRLNDPNGVGEPEWAMVSSVLGLLALLLGFTFSLAVERYENRRTLVTAEAVAIDGLRLRANMLDPPHGAMLTEALRRYTAQRIELAHAHPKDAAAMLRRNDQLLEDIWAAVAAAFPTIGNTDFASALVDSAADLTTVEAARRAARGVRVPSEVFGVLFIYNIVAAGFLGYVATGIHGRAGAVIVLALLTLSLLLIIDIDRPTLGGIRESQAPMEYVLGKFEAPP